MPDDPFLYRFEHDSVQATVALLGERWTLLVLREAFFGVRRFGELQRNLGVARTVLSSRLKRLVAAGLLERRQYRSEPAWFEYRLTERGLDFYPVSLALMAWGDKHLAGPEGVPTRLRHRTCGELADPTMVCGNCGGPIDPREIRVEPGPGA